jgi:hypothetical protein
MRQKAFYEEMQACKTVLLWIQTLQVGAMQAGFFNQRHCLLFINFCEKEVGTLAVGSECNSPQMN